MGQEKLNAWGILSIESYIAASINFEEVIGLFAGQKTRKKNYKNCKYFVPNTKFKYCLIYYLVLNGY